VIGGWGLSSPHPPSVQEWHGDLLPWSEACAGTLSRVGATIPLKFEVSAGSRELADPSIVKPLTTTQAPCSAGPADVVELVATGATSLRYDLAEGQFIYNWQTPKKPGFCYLVTVALADGSSASASFQLK